MNWASTFLIRTRLSTRGNLNEHLSKMRQPLLFVLEQSLQFCSLPCIHFAKR